MNKISNKKNISIFILTIVALLFIFLIYVLSKNIVNYREKVLVDYTTMAQLELDKKVFDLYKKVLIKDSDEAKKIQKYIFSDDRKELLLLINQLEDYTKRNSLISDSSAILSISKRDNDKISKFNAKDLVINIFVTGETKKIEDFLKLLDNLPLISYIEKLDIKYDHITNKSSANISLIIYHKNEIK